jgi:hypothetical protein
MKTMKTMTTMKPFVLSALVALACSAVISAQANPDLAGTWTIDRGAGSGGRGIAGIPLPTTLVITLSPNDVTMETDTGSGQTLQSFVYKLDGSSNPVPGALGWDTKANASWDGRHLVVMTRRSMTGPTGPMGVDVKDVYSVAGDVLTIDRSMGRVTQKLVYRKGVAR